MHISFVCFPLCDPQMCLSLVSTIKLLIRKDTCWKCFCSFESFNLMYSKDNKDYLVTLLFYSFTFIPLTYIYIISTFSIIRNRPTNMEQ